MARTPKPTDLEIAFRAFQNRIEALTLPTSAAGPVASPDELRAFADHLSEAGDAFRAYASAVTANLAHIATSNIPDHTGALEDAIGDIAGAIRRAGRRMQEAA